MHELHAGIAVTVARDGPGIPASSRGRGALDAAVHGLADHSAGAAGTPLTVLERDPVRVHRRVRRPTHRHPLHRRIVGRASTCLIVIHHRCRSKFIFLKQNMHYKGF